MDQGKFFGVAQAYWWQAVEASEAEHGRAEAQVAACSNEVAQLVVEAAEPGLECVLQENYVITKIEN